MRTVFLDTVGLIAVWSRRDQWHTAADSVYRTFDPRTTRLVTTSYILLECAKQAVRRSYRTDVVRLREDLGLVGDLFEATPVELDQAWNDYSRGAPGTASVVDLISFSVMRRLGITQAFTSDKHFASAGFEVLF
ncbi:MAG: PIN domain-containing protein [Planctomycetaceae bacterium]|nr:PIN domain-containing protein [Planctomycetaceae bacterium]